MINVKFQKYFHHILIYHKQMHDTRDTYIAAIWIVVLIVGIVPIVVIIVLVVVVILTIVVPIICCIGVLCHWSEKQKPAQKLNHPSEEVDLKALVKS